MRLPKRNHICNQKNININFKKKYKNKIGFKPEGLWYSCYNSWLNWILENDMDWKHGNYIHKINLKSKILTDINHKNSNKLLVIKNIKDLDKLNTEYGIKGKHQYLDWQKISQDYAGIEICPYLKEIRFTYNWYYTFDVASGCIWNLSALVKDTKLIYQKHGEKYILSNKS